MATSWQTSPPTLQIREMDLHVWRVSLSQRANLVAELATLLSDQEKDRARRFHFEHDQKNFVVSRGILRRLLGQYLHYPSETLDFNYGPQGKPYLARECARNDIRFNLAHSHDLALYAFTIGREVGIDLEQMRTLSNLELMAKHTFSANEYTVFQELPSEQRLRAFFTCWVRKEAYIKARGNGFSFAPDRFSVSITLGEEARLLHVEGEAQEPERWTLMDITVQHNYAGALAVEGRGVNPLFIDFEQNG